MWKKGESGNLKGRPEGAREHLRNNFLVALNEDFKASGVAAIVAMRTTDPSGYVRAICSLMPKEFDVKRADPFEALSDEQLIELVGGLDARIVAIGEGQSAGHVEAQPSAEASSKVH